jgi:integrin-linked kinase
VAKILAVRDCTSRVSRDFNEEFPKLRLVAVWEFNVMASICTWMDIVRLNTEFCYYRIFSHPNVLPVVGCCNSPPNLVVINQYMAWGSLYTLLHEGTGVVVDTAQALRFALDVARGMAFLHSLERIIPEYHLNSRHVMVSTGNMHWKAELTNYKHFALIASM